jgi:hypothetical protein
LGLQEKSSKIFFPFPNRPRLLAVKPLLFVAASQSPGDCATAPVAENQPAAIKRGLLPDRLDCHPPTPDDQTRHESR